MNILLSIFDYAKRYHSDVLDCVAIVFELLLFRQKSPKVLDEIIAQGKKRGENLSEFNARVSQKIHAEILRVIESGAQDSIKDSAQVFKKNTKESAQDSIKESAPKDPKKPPKKPAKPPLNFIWLNPSINLLKLLKTIRKASVKAEQIEEFLHIITQKKTTNKLFTYSTPKEINELLIALLEIKKGQSIYNPCYGMGSLFLSLKERNIALFGEELDARLAHIAQLLAAILNIQEANLFVNDILKTPKFGDQKFDKIICNPPLLGHAGLEFLKNRFEKLYAKSYPELFFLIHCLGHLGGRGVFIIRTQTLQKSSVEAGFRKRLLRENLLEAIIELPKNIFPHQNYDFSIIVLNAAKCGSVRHVDASSFFVKDGKYNRLSRIDEIVESALRGASSNNKSGEFVAVNKTLDLDVSDLSASHYVRQNSVGESQKSVVSLSDLGVEILRGGRGYNGRDKVLFYDIGIADFAPLGFSKVRLDVLTKRNFGDKKRIKEFALAPYDLLLSLRGASPKFGIMDDSVRLATINANAGILTLRAPTKSLAIALYCYFFSNSGLNALSQLYENAQLNVGKLLELKIPKNFEKGAEAKMAKISALAAQMEALNEEIRALR